MNLTRKWKTIAGLWALAVCLVPVAQADSTPAVSIDFDESGRFSDFYFKVSGSEFTDNFSFELTEPNNLILLSASQFVHGPISGQFFTFIEDFRIDLTDLGVRANDTVNGFEYLGPLLLGAGTYEFSISGRNVGSTRLSGFYALAVQVLPVPITQPAFLLVGGIGLLMCMRRRTRTL